MPTQPRLPGLPADPHAPGVQGERSHLGAEAEQYLKLLHETCWRAGVAWVVPTSSNVRITKRLAKGFIEGVLVGKSTVDFMGFMLDGTGRAVVVEAKHVAAERLKDGSEAAWRLPLDRIEPHQKQILADCDRAGGVALVLVAHAGKAFAVPWAVVAVAIADGKASLLGEEIARHACPPGKPYLSRWTQAARRGGA